MSMVVDLPNWPASMGNSVASTASLKRKKRLYLGSIHMTNLVHDWLTLPLVQVSDISSLVPTFHSVGPEANRLIRILFYNNSGRSCPGHDQRSMGLPPFSALTCSKGCQWRPFFILLDSPGSATMLHYVFLSSECVFSHIFFPTPKFV